MSTDGEEGQFDQRWKIVKVVKLFSYYANRCMAKVKMMVISNICTQNSATDKIITRFLYFDLLIFV